MSDLDRTIDLLHGQVNLGKAGAKERLAELQASLAPATVEVTEDDGNYRSAVSGKFVTEEYADDNPDTTVFEDDDGYEDVDEFLADLDDEDDNG